MAKPPRDKPLTPGQVADLFNVSVTTVGKWADAGKLPHFKTLGGQRRFRREDIERFLAAGDAPPEPEKATA